MNWYSLLGPVDTQIDYDDEETFAAKHIKEFRKKSWAREKDYLRGLEADSIHNDDEHLLNVILKNNNNKDRIIKRLLNTKYSHGISYTRNDIRDMGLPVVNEVPQHIMLIFNIYNYIFKYIEKIEKKSYIKIYLHMTITLYKTKQPENTKNEYLRNLHER